MKKMTFYNKENELSFDLSELIDTFNISFTETREKCWEMTSNLHLREFVLR